MTSIFENTNTYTISRLLGQVQDLARPRIRVKDLPLPLQLLRPSIYSSPKPPPRPPAPSPSPQRPAVYSKTTSCSWLTNPHQANSISGSIESGIAGVNFPRLTGKTPTSFKLTFSTRARIQADRRPPLRSSTQHRYHLPYLRPISGRCLICAVPSHKVYSDGLCSPSRPVLPKSALSEPTASLTNA